MDLESLESVCPPYVEWRSEVVGLLDAMQFEALSFLKPVWSSEQNAVQSTSSKGFKRLPRWFDMVKCHKVGVEMGRVYAMGMQPGVCFEAEFASVCFSSRNQPFSEFISPNPPAKPPGTWVFQSNPFNLKTHPLNLRLKQADCIHTLSMSSWHQSLLPKMRHVCFDHCDL